MSQRLERTESDMKTKRRHELQHNTLDAELGKTVAFFKKHGWTIVWSVLGLVAVWVAISTWRSSQATNRGQTESKYAMAHADVLDLTITGKDPGAVLGVLDELIDQTAVPRVSALSCVDAGDLCAVRARRAAEALGAARATGAAPSVIAAQRKEFDTYVARAGDYYGQARDAMPDEQQIVAKAHIGLAKLAETKAGLLDGDKRTQAFADALGEYKRVASLTRAVGSPTATFAENAINRLYDAQGQLRADYTSAVRMATTLPAAPEPPATQPASKPADKTPKAGKDAGSDTGTGGAP